MRARLAPLVLLVVLTIATACAPAPTDRAPGGMAGEARALEDRAGMRIGFVAVDTGSGHVVGHRADESFHLCSTGKALLAGAVLRRAQDERGLLDRRLTWAASALVPASPFTGARLGVGASVEELAAAAVSSSDNTASNLLHEQIGGPAATTAFVRGLGDPVTRLDHLEPMPRGVAAGDARDTTTPRWYAHDLRALAFGPALAPDGRARLVDWMRRATTGLDQIRAAVPPGWAVGDKTGACSQGLANDVAVIRPPHRAPLVIAVFTEPRTESRSDGAAVIAGTARVALGGLGVPTTSP